MIKFGNDIVTVGGDWLKFGYLPRIYHVTVSVGQHGTATVNPTEGLTGTLVTISTAPDTGYELDTISLTGATLINGNQFYIEHSDVTVNVSFAAINYNPLNLPAYSIRLRIDTHNFWEYDVKGTVTHVTNDVIDITYANPDWTNMFGSANHLGILEVLGANTTGVTSMQGLFTGCHYLTSIPIFDTSSVTNAIQMFISCDNIVSFPNYDTHNVTNMAGMFAHCKALEYAPALNTSNVTNTSAMFSGCKALKAIPLYDTSKITDMESMFAQCKYVESGILAFYQQASTQTVPPSNHYGTFYQCGVETPSGYAEYLQLPSSWTQG